MRKLLLLILPLLAVSLISCNKDSSDENGPNTSNPTIYSGKEALNKMKGAYSVAVREWDYNLEEEENYVGKNYNATIYVQDASNAIRVNWNNQIITFSDYECNYTIQPQDDFTEYSEYGYLTHKSAKLEFLFTISIDKEGKKEIFGRIRKYESNANLEWYFE